MAVNPPLVAVIMTAGSTAEMMTLTVHTPALNDKVVGVIGRLPLCPVAERVPLSM